MAPIPRLSTHLAAERAARVAYGVGRAGLTVAGRVFFPRLRLAAPGLITAFQRGRDRK